MVVASLLMIALPLSSMIRPVFGLMTVLFALNDLYYYTGILWRARTRAAIRDLWNWFAASLPEIIAHGTSFIDNYRLKLRRPMGSDRIVIPAAEKNDSSWGFPNRRKYDSLHIEAVRGEFASDGQGDRDHLF
jgi:hypothetical protein